MALKVNPNMFGLPYQFPSTVDPRIKDISPYLGRKYVENISTEAPVCTFIPGVPSYLSNDNNKNKMNTAIALLQGSTISNGIGGYSLSKRDFNSMRLYDFKNDYTSYMKYVNILCRAGALFLDLGDTKLGDKKLSNYNWSNYRWENKTVNSISGKLSSSAKSKLNITTNNGSDSSLNTVLQNKYFVQFYVDSDVSASESFGNTTSESMIKSTLDTGSNTMKELAFMANSGVGADFSSFVDSSADALTSGVTSMLSGGTMSNALSKIINLSSDTLRGNNIIMPDIYQSSNYSKSYSLTVHLKSPYGNKLGYYMNIFVPLMHLVALAMPRQASANSYESPFIVKAYVDGVFSCNMGIIQSLSIQKIAESWSIEGLPSEVDVTLDLVDLYSGIQMSPASDPLLFMNNSSLVEYLCVNCGLSLTSPNIDKKAKLLAGNLLNSVTDIPQNAMTRVKESIYSWANNSILKLYN